MQFDAAKVEIVEYGEKSNKDRRVYCRFVSEEDDSIVTLPNGAKFAQGWELTTLDDADRSYFDANLGDFFSLQNNLPKPVLRKVERWKIGDEAIFDDVATLFKNRSYALRWFRLR
jgi:hypothetical protein